MESSTMVNGLGQTGMVTVFKSGPTELNIKAHGKKIKLVEKASLFMPMVIHMMVNGKMIRPMDSEYFCMQNLKPNTKATGKTI